MWVLLWGALALADTGDTGSDTGTTETGADTGSAGADTGVNDTGVNDTGAGDTADTDTDTGDGVEFASPSASGLSGEVGGFRCASGVPPGTLGLLLGFVLLWRRR